MEFLRLLPKLYSACPVPALTVLGLSKRGNIPGVKVRGFFYCLTSSKPKFYLDSFPILNLSLKMFQWMGISSHLFHRFPPASILNDIWAWKQVFRSYFQFPNLDSLFLTAMNSFLLTKEIPYCFHSSVPVWKLARGTPIVLIVSIPQAEDRQVHL